MSSLILCPLCKTRAVDLIPNYYHCPNCDLRFLDPQQHMNPAAERTRYELHNNTFADPRYREFLKPLAEAVKTRISPPATGVDFGCGPAPVLADILEGMGYQMQVYDPFFYPQDAVLKGQYDFICASEVVEHFCSPAKEFQKLRSLLRSGGHLAVMTAVFNDSMDFNTWYYRRDPTHVVFYSKKTFLWIAANFQFTEPQFIGERIILMSADQKG